MVCDSDMNYLEEIQKKIKKGRGQGEGENYIPWIKVNEVPSKGRSTTCTGWINTREHHFLSELETSYFLVLQWSDIVTDIREQFPLLPVEETLQIAENLRIKHPTHPYKKNAEVMTTDFLINIENKKIARTIKYSRDLNSNRKLEKLKLNVFTGHKKALTGVL